MTIKHRTVTLKIGWWEDQVEFGLAKGEIMARVLEAFKAPPGTDRQGSASVGWVGETTDDWPTY